MFPLAVRQREHVAEIVAEGQLRGLPRLAMVYAVATAGAESSLMNWENWGTSTLVGLAEGRPLNAAEMAVARLSKGLGDGPYKVNGLVVDNLDSMGLFAQRPMTGWGTPEDIMRPAYAAGKFYERLVATKDWQTLPAPQVLAKVQGIRDTASYAKWLPTADAVVPNSQ